MCADALVRQHQNLVHLILRRQCRHDLPYEDLFQEGLIGLWQAILHFDPQRGYTFSSYAGVAIARRLWLVIHRLTRPQGFLPPPEPPDPVEAATRSDWLICLHTILQQTLPGLPPRLQEILHAHYGLGGAPPQSLTQIGRQLGLTPERVRQLRNEALHCLRLPARSAPLRRLGDHNDRAAYCAARAQRRAYQRAQRRRLK
jgi:RNA polymerase primary sigma factor